MTILDVMRTGTPEEIAKMLDAQISDVQDMLCCDVCDHDDDPDWQCYDCWHNWLNNEVDMEDKVKEDKVNHPRHYDLPGGGQAIDVITDMLDDTEIEGYYKGNIIKYIARYKGESGAESLKKARWYLDKLIALKETQEEIDAR